MADEADVPIEFFDFTEIVYVPSAKSVITMGSVVPTSTIIGSSVPFINVYVYPVIAAPFNKGTGKFTLTDVPVTVGEANTGTAGALYKIVNALAAADQAEYPI